MTRWSPDTCGCVIEYDGNIAATATISKCAKHASAANPAAHLTAVLAHNRAKNTARDYFVTTRGIADTPTRELQVYYDASDLLHVANHGLSAGQVTTTQTAANTRFGVGKVKIEAT